jgi:DNA-binding XRE family transcriptional regulator
MKWERPREGKMKEIKRYRPDMVEDPNGAYVLFSDVSELLIIEENELMIAKLGSMAEIVREIRFNYGLSQGELARMVGLDQSHISQIESGKIYPTMRVLARMLVKARETLKG